MGDHLDLAAIVKVLQEISSENAFDRLIERLMTVAVEHSGAQRGVLVRQHGAIVRIEAEATIDGPAITVRAVAEPAESSLLPHSVLAHVLRTHEPVLLDEASAVHLFSGDDYIVRTGMRSLLCLPLVRLGIITGALYLESNLASHVFTPERVGVLRLLVSQVAASLELAQLRAEVHASNDRLRLALDTIPAIVASLTAEGVPDFVNQRAREYTGVGADRADQNWREVLHRDDYPRVSQAFADALSRGTLFEAEGRIRGVDGVYRWFLHRALPVRNANGAIVRWFACAHDIDDLKRAEEKVREDERELRQLLDYIPYLVASVGVDGRMLRVNRAVREYLGASAETILRNKEARIFYHPDDVEAVDAARQLAFLRGTANEVEARARRHDGQYRWFLIHYEPLRDVEGRVVRWHVTAADIDERKKVEERMLGENLALREQIAQASAFDQIVGGSAPLRRVLSHVSKVAATDSTVLITGETGTGKELVARATHKRSSRAQGPFISLNCAAIPPALIPSELFGHEKGAFTGALQRRLGRFEMAERGTIFLDEVGELPAETQIALLRVLQEREFERVGGSRPIQVDVRVIAATNRDLKAAVAEGTFRSDLYYRLNVFPVEVPPLRERRDDIPLLATYFLERYARSMGKKIRGIDEASLDLLLSYHWPGNIRELQNVIERSVIISDSELLVVDERWLFAGTAGAAHKPEPLVRTLEQQEKAHIEAALAATKGRVSGPSGAAAKLGMRPSTLESKIRSLGINKHAWRTS